MATPNTKNRTRGKDRPADLRPLFRRPSTPPLFFLAGVVFAVVAYLMSRPHETGMGSGWQLIVGHPMPPRVNLSAMLGFSILSLAWFCLSFLTLRALFPYAEVTVDRSGVRWKNLTGGGGYLAFEAIRDARVETRPFLGVKHLVLTRDDARDGDETRADRADRTIRISIGSASPNVVLNEVLTGLERWRRASSTDPGDAPAAQLLARNHRSMADWIASLDAPASLPEDPGAYRRPFVSIDDPATLATLVTKDSLSVEVRAAAAYRLGARFGDHREVLARALSTDAPPLVISMAALSLEMDEGGKRAALLNPEMVRNARALLDAETRDELDRVLEQRRRLMEARVRVATDDPTELEEDVVSSSNHSARRTMRR